MDNISLKVINARNLSEDFQNYLENKEKFSKLYNTNTLPAKITFYEWSEFNQFKFFKTDKDLFDFLRTCRIWTTVQEDKDIKSLSHLEDGVYIVCKKGESKVLIAESLKSLKAKYQKDLEEKEKKTKESTTTTVTTVGQTHSVPSQYPINPYCGFYGCDYGDYDEWE